MRAVGLMSFGPAEVLRAVDLPEPEPAPGQVLVEVAAATVNPTDVLLRSGQQAASMSELAPPYVPGMEFSGSVLALGQGVQSLRVGAAVMGVVNPRRPEGGAQAERLSVPAASLVGTPCALGQVEAATVPMNGLTALKVVDALDLGPGVPVLVTGGAGALGGYVIQLAKHRGLRVIADAKGADRALLELLGADEIVPRGEGMVDAVRALVPEGVAGLVDAALVGAAVRQLVRDDGICVSVRGDQGTDDTKVRHEIVSVTRHLEDSAALAEVARLASAGVLTPRVAHRFPMEQAAKAHRLVERGGVRGRVVLTFID